MVQCVMGAVSDDGIRWKKSDQPLPDSTGDAAFPKPEPGRIGDFHRPCCIGKTAMGLWFDYWLPGQGVCMGYAENRGDFLRSGDSDPTRPGKTLLSELAQSGSRPRWRYVPQFCGPSGYPLSRRIALEEPAVAGGGFQRGLIVEKTRFIPPDDDSDACHVPQAWLSRWMAENGSTCSMRHKSGTARILIGNITPDLTHPVNAKSHVKR